MPSHVRRMDYTWRMTLEQCRARSESGKSRDLAEFAVENPFLFDSCLTDLVVPLFCAPLTPDFMATVLEFHIGHEGHGLHCPRSWSQWPFQMLPWALKFCYWRQNALGKRYAKCLALSGMKF